MILQVEVYERMYRVDALKEKARTLVLAGILDNELWHNRIIRCWKAIEKRYDVKLFDDMGVMIPEQQFYFAKYSLARMFKCSVGQFIYVNNSIINHGDML